MEAYFKEFWISWLDLRLYLLQFGTLPLDLMLDVANFFTLKIDWGLTWKKIFCDFTWDLSWPNFYPATWLVAWLNQIFDPATWLEAWLEIALILRLELTKAFNLQLDLSSTWFKNRGDCSHHLHKLLKFFDEQRVPAEGPSRGSQQRAGLVGLPLEMLLWARFWWKLEEHYPWLLWGHSMSVSLRTLPFWPLEPRQQPSIGVSLCDCWRGGGEMPGPAPLPSREEAWGGRPFIPKIAF